MAQTKRKRRTKHRGTAAGTISSRGRTGRPPTAEERKKQAKMTARERRMNTPPTWKASLTRATLAAGIMFIFLVVISKGKHIGSAVGLGVVALVFYVPAGYYMDQLIYRRRQKKREEAR
jgi:Flp pilus assembly protein TadB